MKPFSIRCTTCQAGLVVRNAEAIGQILACPKCGSMVLVEAQSSTASESPASSAADAQETVADSTFDDAAAMFQAAASPVHGDAPLPQSGQHEVAGEPPTESPVPAGRDGETAPGTEPNAEGHSAEVDSPAAEVATTGEDATLPAADWTSSSTLQLKQYLLAGAAGITGVVVALGAIVYFVSGGDGDTDPNALSVAAADADRLAATQSDAAMAETASDDQELSSKATPEANPEQARDKNDTTPDAGADSDTTPDAGADSDTTPDAGADSDTTEPADEIQVPADDPVVPVGEPVDPLPLPAQEEIQPAEDPQMEEPDEPAGPEDLLVEDSFLDDNLTPGTAEEKPEVPENPVVGPTADENKIAGQPQPTERNVDVQKQLSIRLPAIELKDTSLADFLAVMERLTTVPITVDLEALAWARVNLDTPISVNLEDASIEEILQSALGAIRLGHVVETHDVLVTVMNRKDTLRQHRFAVDDLIADNAVEGKALMSTIQRFVKPDTWAIHGGTATLTLDGQELAVSQTDQGILDVLLFLEQLRVARGVGQQSKYPHELLQVESPTLLAVAAIDQRVSLNFSQPTPLGDILRRLGDDVGMRIVVDWRTAGQLGWSPATETTLVVEEKSLEDSLNALLRPLKLGFRIINSRTMQITTAERVIRRRQLEMYPLPVSNNMTAAQAAQQLHRAGALSDDAQANTYFDPASGYLLAWLTQAEQIDLARAVHAMQP